VKIGASVVVGYYSQEQETLPFESTPIDFVRRLKRMTEPQAIGVLRRLLFTYRDMHTSIKPPRRASARRTAGRSRRRARG
jgi:ATP-binding cassette, subfamily F, member 3